MTAQPYIMIVEDDVYVADVYLKTLLKAGFQAEVVNSVAEAEAYLARVQPDVIVLDIGLPDGSGNQVLDYIHARSALAQSQIVVTTGLKHFALPPAARIHSVLLKPVSSLHLRGLVTQLCRPEPRTVYIN